jgi:hypothetical protein
LLVVAAQEVGDGPDEGGKVGVTHGRERRVGLVNDGQWRRVLSSGCLFLAIVGH